ncbi:MAG: TonB-dependent receptor [Salinivirgaceae bacterium]|jgi:outer membrane receptor for ferrienterochelin and colicin|nr:TonB-dependent receptor [Salinivirgaceae bacterium]
MYKIKFSLALLCVCISFILNAQAQLDTILESALELSIEQLMNTKVSIATKSEQKLSEAPAIVTVITEEVIKNSGARNLADILKDVPGFEFSKSRTGIINIGVRGVKDILTSARFLVLKDGVAFNDPMYSSGISMTKQFDLNSIERIEVIRGPGSALYGRNAFIGVVNIITKSGIKKNQLELRTSIGNFNTTNYGASYGTKRNDFKAYLSFEKVRSDVTNSTYNDGMGGESTWNIGIDNLTLNTNLSYKNLQLSVMYSDIVNNASTGKFNTDSDKSPKIGIYSLSYSNQLNSNVSLNSRIYGRNEKQVQNLEIYKPNIAGDLKPGLPVRDIYPNGAYATPKYSSYLYGTDINFGLSIFDKNHSLLGIQCDLYGISNVELYSSYDAYTGAPLQYVQNGTTLFRGKNTQIKEERGWIEGNGHDYTNFALYLQHVYSPLNNLSFTLGGRYDIDSEFGGVFNPRLAAVWNTEKKLIVKLLYGQAYRAPNTQEQYKLTGFTVGNKDLNPETIKTFEFSLDYNFSSKVNNRLTIYYNTIGDMVAAKGVTSGVAGGPYQNIGKNTSRGFEYELKMVLNKQFYMFANYSFTNSENEVTINDTTDTYSHRDIAPHKINVGVNYRFLKYLNLYTGLTYRSTREKYFALNPLGGYILDESGNKTFVSQNNVGNYMLLNSKLRIIDIIKGLEISAEVYNVLDTKYYDQDNEFAYQPIRERRQYIITAKYIF